MKDYSKGQIYKVWSPNHGQVYYGSTTMTLKDRFKSHKSDKSCSSREIINAGNADIQHIEWFPCCSKHELEDRESIFIVKDWDGCVNECVPGAMRRAGVYKAYNAASPEAQSHAHAQSHTHSHPMGTSTIPVHPTKPSVACARRPRSLMTTRLASLRTSARMLTSSVRVKICRFAC